MEIKIGKYKIKRHNELCWEVFEYRMTTPRGKHKDLEPEEKWISTGKYPSTLALALTEVYEMAVKTEPGLYELKDAIAAAKRIERGIERAAKAALEGGVE